MTNIFSISVDDLLVLYGVFGVGDITKDPTMVAVMAAPSVADVFVEVDQDLMNQSEISLICCESTLVLNRRPGMCDRKRSLRQQMMAEIAREVAEEWNFDQYARGPKCRLQFLGE